MDSEIVAAIIMAIASVAPSSIAAIRDNGASSSEPNAELAKWLSEQSEKDAISLARVYAAVWKWKYKEEPSYRITQTVILGTYVPMIAIIAYCLVLSVNSAVQNGVPILEVLSKDGGACMLAALPFIAVLGILLVIHDSIRKRDIDEYLWDAEKRFKLKYMRRISRVLCSFSLVGTMLIIAAFVLCFTEPSADIIFPFTILVLAGALITIVAEKKWVSLFCRADDLESGASEEQHSCER